VLILPQKLLKKDGRKFCSDSQKLSSIFTLGSKKIRDQVTPCFPGLHPDLIIRA